MEREKLFQAIGIIIVIIGVGYFIANFEVPECLNGHTETQWEMPVGVVVGKTEYFGGISVPVGNAKQVEVFVCDQYK